MKLKTACEVRKDVLATSAADLLMCLEKALTPKIEELNSKYSDVCFKCIRTSFFHLEVINYSYPDIELQFNYPNGSDLYSDEQKIIKSNWDNIIPSDNIPAEKELRSIIESTFAEIVKERNMTISWSLV